MTTGTSIPANSSRRTYQTMASPCGRTTSPAFIPPARLPIWRRLSFAIAALRNGCSDASALALPDALSKPVASPRHKTSRFLAAHHQPGFTLIETLMALMVFSVGMLGLSGLTTVIVRENTLSQQITTATVLAQDKLEAYTIPGTTRSPINRTSRRPTATRIGVPSTSLTAPPLRA